jgi:hypothetical protein
VSGPAAGPGDALGAALIHAKEDLFGQFGTDR